jgi:pimeloyl-ACP methyl ester carboxylesterase
MLSDTSKDTNGDDAVVQFLEAFKQGKEGCIQDGECLTREWGFDVANIPARRVWLVHGDKDGVAPVSMAEWINKRLGGGRLKVVEGATHFTIWKEYEEEVFKRAKEMVDM